MLTTFEKLAPQNLKFGRFYLIFFEERWNQLDQRLSNCVGRSSLNSYGLLDCENANINLCNQFSFRHLTFSLQNSQITYFLACQELDTNQINVAHFLNHNLTDDHRLISFKIVVYTIYICFIQLISRSFWFNFHFHKVYCLGGLGRMRIQGLNIVKIVCLLYAYLFLAFKSQWGRVFHVLRIKKQKKILLDASIVITKSDE